MKRVSEIAAFALVAILQGGAFAAVGVTDADAVMLRRPAVAVESPYRDAPGVNPGATIEKAVPVVEKKDATIEKAAPVIEKKDATIEKAAPVIEKKDATIEKAAPVIEKKDATIEKAAPVIEKKSATIEKAVPVVEKAAAPVEQAAPVIEKEATAVAAPVAPALAAVGTNVGAASVAPAQTNAIAQVANAATNAQVVVAKPSKKLTGRESVITAVRTDYDRKEGVILFDRNVHVDDEQYQLYADKLYVFLRGTNELDRIVALGHVAITNEERSAACARATYTKALSKIIMWGDEAAKARLHDGSKNDSTVLGDKITFYLNSEQVEIEGSSVSMPGAALKGKSPKDLLHSK